MPATGKPIRGGWAVTLKSAAQQGLPVQLTDPQYLDKWRYVGALELRMGMHSHYDQAIRERARQEIG